VRDGLTVSFALPKAGLSCPSSARSSTQASEGQDHTPSPSAPIALVSHRPRERSDTHRSPGVHGRSLAESSPRSDVGATANGTDDRFRDARPILVPFKRSSLRPARRALFRAQAKRCSLVGELLRRDMPKSHPRQLQHECRRQAIIPTANLRLFCGCLRQPHSARAHAIGAHLLGGNPWSAHA
jgi:hypothetical protein